MVTIDITPYCGSSRNWNTEILACKIAQNCNEKILLNLKHEGWDIVENGIEQKVKNICDEFKIHYTQIEFRSTDRLRKSKIFKHNTTTEKQLLNFFTRYLTDVDIVLSNKFKYGLFCARASNERLYSFWKHKNWQHSTLGKASLHLNITEVKEWESDFTPFICDHPEKWQSLLPLLPYSDIGAYNKPPIIFGNAKDTNFWVDLYNNISVEIICETNITSDTFFITEKTFRPIAYGKLFLVIGSPFFEQNLKKMGFDIFDDIIDKSYDSESGYIRVDKVFRSLSKLLSNPVDMQALFPRLQANNQVIKNL